MTKGMIWEKLRWRETSPPTVSPNQFLPTNSLSQPVSRPPGTTGKDAGSRQDAEQRRNGRTHGRRRTSVQRPGEGMSGYAARALLLAVCAAALLRGGHGQSTCQTMDWDSWDYRDGGSCCSGNARECCHCSASWDNSRIQCVSDENGWNNCAAGAACGTIDVAPEMFGGSVSGAPTGWDAGLGPHRAGLPYSLCPACTEPGKHIAEGRAGTNCVPCAAGKFTASHTATSCEQCPEGKLSSVGAASCEDVPEDAELSTVTLSSVSPAACDADTPANACMREMRLLIEGDKITLYPGIAESGSDQCPTNTGTIDRDSGVASGTSVSVSEPIDSRAVLRASCSMFLACRARGE